MSNHPLNWKIRKVFLREITAQWNTKSKRICTSGIDMSMFEWYVDMLTMKYHLMLRMTSNLLSKPVPETSMSTCICVPRCTSLPNFCFYSDGNFEMIMSTDRMVLSHVYEKKIQKFSSRDGWSVNFINTIDHIVKDHNSYRKIALLPDQVYTCQEIEVMYTDNDNILLKACFCIIVDDGDRLSGTKES